MGQPRRVGREEFLRSSDAVARIAAAVMLTVALGLNTALIIIIFYGILQYLGCAH